MSTNSSSVISDITASFAHNMNVQKYKTSGNSVNLEYDYKEYDIHVTKLCSNCGEKMDFGSAIRCLKHGLKVAREGWNGKQMYLWLLPASTIKREWVKDPKLLDAFEGRDELECLGSIRMFTADKKVLTGWLASQTDMLADDWVVVG